MKKTNPIVKPRTPYVAAFLLATGQILMAFSINYRIQLEQQQSSWLLPMILNGVAQEIIIITALLYYFLSDNGINNKKIRLALWIFMGLTALPMVSWALGSMANNGTAVGFFLLLGPILFLGYIVVAFWWTMSILPIIGLIIKGKKNTTTISYVLALILLIWSGRNIYLQTREQLTLHESLYLNHDLESLSTLDQKIDFCNKIKFKENHNDCLGYVYMQEYQKTKDSKYCYKISSPNIKSNCLLAVAVSTSYTKYCQDIPVKYIQMNCNRDLGKKTYYDGLSDLSVGPMAMTMKYPTIGEPYYYQEGENGQMLIFQGYLGKIMSISKTNDMSALSPAGKTVEKIRTTDTLIEYAVHDAYTDVVQSRIIAHNNTYYIFTLIAPDRAYTIFRDLVGSVSFYDN